jgi:hypothetical protein
MIIDYSNPDQARILLFTFPVEQAPWGSRRRTDLDRTTKLDRFSVGMRASKSQADALVDGLAVLRVWNNLVKRGLQFVQGLGREWRVFEPEEEGVGDLPPSPDLDGHRAVPVRPRPCGRRQPARAPATS